MTNLEMATSVELMEELAKRNKAVVFTFIDLNDQLGFMCKGGTILGLGMIDKAKWCLLNGHFNYEEKRET